MSKNEARMKEREKEGNRAEVDKQTNQENKKVAITRTKANGR